jgi:hypothetical protein
MLVKAMLIMAMALAAYYKYPPFPLYGWISSSVLFYGSAVLFRYAIHSEICAISSHLKRTSSQIVWKSCVTMPEINVPVPETTPSIENEEVAISSSLEGLQTDEQRRVLDTVDQVRKCGLEGTFQLFHISSKLSG